MVMILLSREREREIDTRKYLVRLSLFFVLFVVCFFNRNVTYCYLYTMEIERVGCQTEFCTSSSK